MVSSLKYKVLLCFSFLSIIFLFVQCSHSAEKKPLNPNGDSELALLMRNMNTSTSSLKELIKQGKLPDRFPEEFLRIHKAVPTDSTVKGPVFDAFASNYLNGLNELYKSPKEQLSVNYNAVVQRCVDCHRQFCPGPIKAINKLTLEN